MASSDAVKPNHPSADGDQTKLKQLDRQLLDMVSAITHRMGHLHKPGGSTVEENNEGGISVITLAGTNTGATMRGQVGEKEGDETETEEAELIAFVNSNIQAVNNSVMFGASYTTNDPGVHMEISQPADGHRDDLFHGQHLHKQKRGLASSKKKEKGAHNSDHPSSAFSDSSSH